jgi:hypothetical protein
MVLQKFCEREAEGRLPLGMIGRGGRLLGTGQHHRRLPGLPGKAICVRSYAEVPLESNPSKWNCICNRPAPCRPPRHEAFAPRAKRLLQRPRVFAGRAY